MQERGELEERYRKLFNAVLAENDPAERERLALELDEVVGERLGHEMANGGEFMAHHRTLVKA